MAIFNNTYFNNDNTIAAEGYDPEFGGHFDIMAESSADQLAIIEAFHAYDIAELEVIKEADESAKEDAKNEDTPEKKEASKKIWTRIKEFIKNIFSRVFGFLKNLGVYITSLVSSNTGFINKYGNKLNNLKFTPFPYKVYEYNVEKSPITSEFTAFESKVNAVMDIANKVINNEDAKNGEVDKFDKEKELNDLRHTLVKDGSADNFDTNLRKHFRKDYKDGGPDEKTISDISDYKKFLMGSKDLQKEINDITKKLYTMDKNIQTTLNKAHAKAETLGTSHGNKLAAKFNTSLGVFSSQISIFTTYLRAWSTAVTEYSKVSKSICVKALTRKPEKK